MCNFWSCIVTKTGKVFYNEFDDDHYKIVSANNLNDTNNGAVRQLFAKVEITPPDDDVFKPLKEWVFNLDEGTTPNWFSNRHERSCWAALKNYLKERVLVGQQGVEIKNKRAWLSNSSAELYYNSSAELYYNSSARLWSNSSAKLWSNSSAMLRDNSSAKLWGNSSAELYGNSSAKLWDNSSAELWDNSSAELYYNSSARLWDNSSAELWDNSSAELYYNSSARLYGNSSAELHNNSSAELLHNSSAELHNNSSALAYSFDPNNKVYDNGTIKDVSGDECIIYVASSKIRKKVLK